MMMQRILIDTALVATTAAMMWGMLMGLLLLLSGAKDCRSTCLVVPLAGHVEDVELLVRETVAAVRRTGLRGAVIYVADFGADEETAAIAQRLCEEFGVTEWVPSGELSGTIETRCAKRNA